MATRRTVTECVVCGNAKDTTAGLCPSCTNRLGVAADLCPEQVVCGPEPDAAAALVDVWGRAHFVAHATTVGRDHEADVAVVQGSVSREHARLLCTSAGWSVEELGSTNGTYVNDIRVQRSAPLESLSVVRFGSIGFFFVTGAALDRLPRLELQSDDTWRDSGPEERAFALLEPSGGGGGLAQIAGKTVQVTPVQFELLALLDRQMDKERSVPAAVRGFVSSHEIVATLSWDTPHPGDSHLKQLVRRVRRAFDRSGLPNPIESRQRFGYRLGFVPKR